MQDLRDGDIMLAAESGTRLMVLRIPAKSHLWAKAPLCVLACVLSLCTAVIVICLSIEKEATCRCRGEARAIDAAQRVVDRAGGSKVWDSIQGLVWESPDGSRNVYYRKQDTIQLAVGSLVFQSRNGDWAVFDYEAKDWEVRRPSRGRLGAQLRERFNKNLLVSFLPYIMCTAASVVDVVGASNASITLRVTGESITCAGLQECLVTIDVVSNRITRALLLGQSREEVTYSRWYSVSGVDVPVLDGRDETRHAVRVFDRAPEEHYITGRN